MTLKELQNMIKEEFDTYMGEADDDLDVAVSDNDVDVDAEMGDEDAAGEEDVLRKIYDLLAIHFGEGEVEDEMGDDMGDIEDVEGEEAPDSELDELSNHGMGKSAKNSSGPNAGYTNAKGVKEGKALQERFQKLANIIK